VKETESIKKARLDLKGKMEDVAGKVREMADRHQIKIVESIEEHLKKNQKMDTFDKIIRYRGTTDVMIKTLRAKIKDAEITEEEKKSALQSLDEFKEEVEKIYRRFQLVF
jgi:hypothetical protein